MRIITRALQASCIATVSLLGVGTALAADDAAVALTATPKPKFSLAAGTYTNVQTVKITDTSRTAKIYYTTDGSTPSTASTPYSVPVAIGSTTTLKAIATEANHTTSAVESVRYTITCQVIGTGCLPSLAPANVAGESAFTLYVVNLGRPTSGNSTSEISGDLVAYPGFSAQGSLPYSITGPVATTAGIGLVVADASGNLWGVQETYDPNIGYSVASTIVELKGAAGNPATLVPTVVATLPATPGVNVGNMAFDRAGNLWLDEYNLTTLDGAASIVEYTAASGYTSTGTVIPYSGTGGPVGDNCGFGASMAFTPAGNLEALEGYSNGTGGCSYGLFEYTPAGTPVTSIYYPNGFTGTQGVIAIDASGNLWVVTESSGCSTNPTSPPASKCTVPSEIYEVSDKGVLLATIAAPASTNNLEQLQSPVFDANGNLWLVSRSVRNSKWCNAASLETTSLYELPAGSTTAIQQAAFNTACLAGPADFYQNIAITPVPAGLL